MSCNTRRRKLWKVLGLDAEAIETLFRNAQKAAQERDDITHGELQEWANARLAKSQRLLSVEIIAELPRSAIGKVLKRELRERLEGGDCAHGPCS